MTEKTQPTDAELKAMWQLHAADIGGIFYYARAVLAKWGTPAPVGAEPVALLVRKNSWRDGQWEAAPPNSPSYGLAWAHQRVYVYTTPQPTQTQPVEREPLTDEQSKALMQAHRTAMLMTCKARVPECGEFAAIAQDLDWLCESLGIKGGQHGTE